MRKTSVFFLIFAVILIVFGVVIKNKAVDKAEEKNIELFRQELDKNGDFIETVEFSTEDTNKINLNLKNTDVNIIGNSEKSYVEIINFNALEYATYENNRSFNIEYDLLSAVTGRAESGNISFNGVRDFVRFTKHNPEKKVNIYLASDSAVKIFDIKINNGNVSVKDILLVSDFNVSINEGDLTVENTDMLSLVNANIKKGDAKLSDIYVANVNIEIENGNASFSTYSDWVYDYDVESETGEIRYNEDIHKGKFAIDNDEINGNFTAHVGVGNVTLKTIAPDVQEPTETQPTETPSTQDA